MSTPDPTRDASPAADASADASADAARVALAEELLQEAVFRSRGEQAGAAMLAPHGGSGRCGLGERAAVVLDLTPRAEQLYAALFPRGVHPETLVRLREVMATWVRRQDALDRRRNHFLKGFRQEHGYERGSYGEAVRARFDAGLATINADAATERTEAARALLALASA